MSDKGSRAGCAIAMGLFLFLPVLYFLGVGPASWIGENYPGTQDFICAVYMPLAFLAEICEPIAIALDWYSDFWV